MSANEEFQPADPPGSVPVPQPPKDFLRLAQVRRMGGEWRTSRLPIPPAEHQVHLALTRDALWAVYRGELRRWRLADVDGVEPGSRPGWLALSVRGRPQSFLFARADECEEWRSHLRLLLASVPTSDVQAGEQPPAVRLEPIDEPPPPSVAIQPLGTVETAAADLPLARTGLMVQAAGMGADAVLEVRGEALPGNLVIGWRAAGTAARAADEAGRREWLGRWFAGQARGVANALLVLLLVHLLLRLAIAAFLPAVARAGLGSFRTLWNAPGPADGTAVASETLAAVAIVLGLHAWPFLLAGCLRMAGTALLLRSAGLATALLMVLPVAVALGAVVPVVAGDNPPSWWVLLAPVDPVNVALFLFGLRYSRRAWQIARLRGIALPDTPSPSSGRVAAGGAVWAATGAFLLVIVFGGLWSGTLQRGAGDPTLAKAAAGLTAGRGRMQTQPREAEQDFRQALALYRSLPPGHPQAEAIRHDIGSCLLNLGIVQLATGRLDDAEPDLRQAMTHYQSLPAAWHQRPMVRQEMAMCRVQLSFLAIHAGRFEPALDEARQARTLLEQLQPSDEILVLLANACQNMGAALTELRRPHEAYGELAHASEVFARLSPSMRAKPLVRLDLASCELGLAVAAFNDRRPGEAANHLRVAFDLLDRLAVELPGEAQVQNKLAFARQLRQQMR